MTDRKRTSEQKPQQGDVGGRPDAEAAPKDDGTFTEQFERKEAARQALAELSAVDLLFVLFDELKRRRGSSRAFEP